MVHCAPSIATESFGLIPNNIQRSLRLSALRTMPLVPVPINHNAFFDIDEDALDIGIKTALGFVDAVQKDQQ